MSLEQIETETARGIIEELWAERNTSLFPKNLGGKDVNGIDFDLLDANIAGCVMVYLERGTLDVWRTAILGLSYRNCEYIIPILNEEAAEYYWRLGRMAELILEDLAKAEQPAV